jgi:hypothetical protein
MPTVIYDTMNNGLFGTTLTWILETLPYLKKQNIRPDWKIDTSCYGTIIPELIIPKDIENGPVNNIVTLTNLKKAHGYKFTQNDFELANSLFFDYFQVRSDVLDDVNSYIAQFKGKTLGVHYRGTDKYTEAQPVSPETLIGNIKTFLQMNTDYKSLFLITDEDRVVQLFLTLMNDCQIKIITTNSKKTKTNIPIHFLNSCNIEHAKQALVDSISLSKCDFVIKTSSCLSDWAKIWNPSLEVYNINKFKYDWFPQAAIQVKQWNVI